MSVEPKNLDEIISNNSIEEIKSLLSSGKLSLENVNEHGDTPLMVSIRLGAPILAIWFINQGANVNHSNSKGEFPVDYAARYDDYKLLEICLEKSLKENIKVSSLYEISIDRWHFQNTLQLFKSKVSPEALNVEYMGKLARLLAGHNAFNQLRTIIHQDMDVDYTRDDGKDILMLALGYGDFSFIETFFQFQKPNLLKREPVSNNNVFEIALQAKAFNFMGKFYHLYDDEEKTAYDSLRIENILTNH